MNEVRFHTPDGSQRTITLRHAFNAGYAGRDTEQVRRHVDELARFGVPAPSKTPTLYPLPAMMASQVGSIQVAHGRTSGEAEWALLVGDSADDLFLTPACDHTDRALEVHGVAWSKQALPNMLGDLAWPLADVEAEFDQFSLRAWVRHGQSRQLIQDGAPGQLLSPSYWVGQLRDSGLLRPGTLLLSGTIPMLEDVDQFADGWQVELADPRGNVSRVSYDLERLPEPWE